VAFHDSKFIRILPDASPEQQATGIGDLTCDREILFQVFPWEISEAQDFYWPMELEVANFATDFPEAAMKTIRD
ncbi:MAG: hypothetical protein KY468_19255, partial [Armatimonadetes bacterium]|nr:hypothetical protein [Armatimonadota bacterium]